MALLLCGQVVSGQKNRRWWWHTSNLAHPRHTCDLLLHRVRAAPPRGLLPCCTHAVSSMSHNDQDAPAASVVSPVPMETVGSTNGSMILPWLERLRSSWPTPEVPATVPSLACQERILVIDEARTRTVVLRERRCELLPRWSIHWSSPQ